MKDNFFKFFYFVFIFPSFLIGTISENKMVILIPSYNNKDWYRKNLDSVFNQNYKNYRVVYVDDCSPDGTGQLVEDYIKEKDQQSRVTLIKNDHRVTAMENIYKAIHFHCHDQEIVIKLDGDDWFSHNDVLSRINLEYQNPVIWLTYGSYRNLPDHHLDGRPYCRPVPDGIKENNKFRVVYKVIEGMTPGHPLTFYAWLFKCIKLEDILYKGKFPTTAYDAAMNFPLMEMAAFHHGFIPDTLYIHNYQSPINDFKIDPTLQVTVSKSYFSKIPYSPLKKPYFELSVAKKRKVSFEIILETENEKNIEVAIRNSIEKEGHTVKNVFYKKDEMAMPNEGYCLNIKGDLKNIENGRISDLIYALEMTGASKGYLKGNKDKNKCAHVVGNIYAWLEQKEADVFSSVIYKKDVQEKERYEFLVCGFLD